MQATQESCTTSSEAAQCFDSGAFSSAPAARADARPHVSIRAHGQTGAHATVRNEFRAGLAHDAANLVGAIGLYCDLLERPGVLQAEHRHYVRELRLLTGRGTSLLRQLLPELAADADRAVELDEAGMTLNELMMTVRQLLPVLQQLAVPEITVTLEAGDGLLESALAADSPSPRARTLQIGSLKAESVERILVNLVQNAVEAMRKAAGSSPASRSGAGGSITLTLTRIGTELRLTVTDDGPGMPAVISRRLLQPEAAAPSGVRGHGHRVVHGLVMASGGRISVRSRMGHGTCVAMRWPVAEPTRLQNTQALPFAHRSPSYSEVH